MHRNCSLILLYLSIEASPACLHIYLHMSILYYVSLQFLAHRNVSYFFRWTRIWILIFGISHLSTLGCEFTIPSDKNSKETIHILPFGSQNCRPVTLSQNNFIKNSYHLDPKYIYIFLIKICSIFVIIFQKIFLYHFKSFQPISI